MKMPRDASTVHAHAPATPGRRGGWPWLIALGLVAATLLVYREVGQCGFVNLDDDAYVEHQPFVNQGLRSAGLAWAFLGVHSSNWHPLTTLSHMLDCELFGLRAAPMHWENVLWHLANSLLVFVAWRALTGTLWRSALVAAIFALHPLHVESVAWISERKDVLHAFFWLLGLWAYARYARQAREAQEIRNLRLETRGQGTDTKNLEAVVPLSTSSARGRWSLVPGPMLGSYTLVALALVFALLAKPMAVTFPCTLLLLDFWPLRRWPERTAWSLFLEKAPLFGLVLIHSVLTFIVQHGSGAGDFGQRFPLGARLGNAIVSYARYAGKTLWPDSLSPLYFHPGYWPLPVLLGCLVALLALTALVVWRARTRPWLAFGWFWFLGTLVPVIGIIQVGAQALADRYMYVPILGLATMLAWEAAALAQLSLGLRRVVIGASTAALIGFAILTARQVPAWKNSIALYETSIAAGEDNAAIRYLLGVSYATAGRPLADVVAQLQRSLQHRPDYVNSLTQLAILALNQQKFDDCRALIEESIRQDPKNPNLHHNLGAFYVRIGRPDEALKHFAETLRLNPKAAGAHLEIGQILSNQNRLAEALPHYEKRAQLSPWDADALCDYGTLLGNLGRFDEAFPLLERALWLRPDLPRARQNLATFRAALAQRPRG